MDDQNKNLTADDTQTVPVEEPAVVEEAKEESSDENQELSNKTEDKVQDPTAIAEEDSQNDSEQLSKAEEVSTELSEEITPGASAEPATPTESASEEPSENEELGEGKEAGLDVGQGHESEIPTSNDQTPDQPLDPNPASDIPDVPGARWYVVHTYSGQENRVAESIKQRIESEHLENKIIQILVPTQEKIEIRGGKKENVKEKIFPGYILVRMVLDDISWLAVRTTQGVTSFVGMSNKPTAISESEVKSIISYMTQGAQPTYKTTFMENDTVKIIDGPFAEFIGKVESVDKERGKVKVLVSIFGRETPVELDFMQVTKL